MTARWFSALEVAHKGIRFSIRPTWPVGTSKIPTGPAKREHEFRVGRRCAARLLIDRGVCQPVGVNPDRSPDWPDGIVGSISHSDRWTIACVASQDAAQSVGVDTEPVMMPETRALINREIATNAEIDLLQSLNLKNESALTLIFSAKESFYKCWYPLTQQFLDFHDVAVVAATKSSLTLRLAAASSPEECQWSELTVSYHISRADVYTFAMLECGQ